MEIPPRLMTSSWTACGVVSAVARQALQHLIVGQLLQQIRYHCCITGVAGCHADSPDL